MSHRDTVRIGTTTGLSRPRPDRSGSDNPCQDFDAEQVYVNVDTTAEPWYDGDWARPARPIMIEGWVGYSTRTRMRLTEQQAKDLALLLGRALDEKGRWR